MIEAIEALQVAFEKESKLSKEWREKHDRDALTFRADILDKYGKMLEKIRPFEEFSTGLSVSWKILLAVSAFVMSVIKAWAWLKEHVK